MVLSMPIVQLKRRNVEWNAPHDGVFRSWY